MCICELGGGTGVNSIACAVLGAKRVTVTDHESVFPLIIKNINKLPHYQCNASRSNRSSDRVTYENTTQSIHVCTYDWGGDIQSLIVPLGGDAAYDLVIVSDCILPKLYPIEPLVKVRHVRMLAIVWWF